LAIHHPDAADGSFEQLEKARIALESVVKDQTVNQMSGSARLDIIRQKNRPVITDYLPLVFDLSIELHGDRGFKDDLALWCGLGSLSGQPVTIIGHRKGRTIEENTRANFGMPHPEGYRKALRLMKQAEKFKRPIICLVDTSGAYCGVGAEERGQGEAIARNLLEMAQLNVPVLCVVMGEGGSGGALAIGVGDELAMLSNTLYSVISPRGFASLLWKDPTREREAADSIKITAEDLTALGICDATIAEPGEGAHTNLSQTATNLRDYLRAGLARQLVKSNEQRLQDRYNKFRRIGSFAE
jgi:acetyl-CoA carboxylase carboxyl transferase subunit alpha